MILHSFLRQEDALRGEAAVSPAMGFDGRVHTQAPHFDGDVVYSVAAARAESGPLLPILRATSFWNWRMATYRAESLSLVVAISTSHILDHLTGIFSCRAAR
jgi:hypothetical protein